MKNKNLFREGIIVNTMKKSFGISIEGVAGNIWFERNIGSTISNLFDKKVIMIPALPTEMGILLE